MVPLGLLNGKDDKEPVSVVFLYWLLGRRPGAVSLGVALPRTLLEKMAESRGVRGRCFFTWTGILGKSSKRNLDSAKTQMQPLVMWSVREVPILLCVSNLVT